MQLYIAIGNVMALKPTKQKLDHEINLLSIRGSTT